VSAAVARGNGPANLRGGSEERLRSPRPHPGGTGGPSQGARSSPHPRDERGATDPRPSEAAATTAASGPDVSDGTAAGALAGLLAALAEEERASRELCDLGRQKQRVLVAGAAADLPALVQAEQVMLAGLSRSEVRRLAATRSLAGALGLPAGASLELLSGALDGGSAATLRQVGRRIAASLAEVRALNEQNAALIRQSLAFVNFSLGVLGRALGEAGTYTAGGRRPRRDAPPRALDREA
jgi:flagellar biosynthesis/type III secretory pathway chaperone